MVPVVPVMGWDCCAMPRLLQSHMAIHARTYTMHEDTSTLSGGLTTVLIFSGLVLMGNVRRAWSLNLQGRVGAAMRRVSTSATLAQRHCIAGPYPAYAKPCASCRLGDGSVCSLQGTSVLHIRNSSKGSA